MCVISRQKLVPQIRVSFTKDARARQIKESQDKEGKKGNKKKKRKKQEETLRKKGERLMKNQPKIVEWLRSDDKRQRKTRKGGKKGIG